MKKLSSSFVILFIFFGSIFGQNTISFKNPKHNFGTIKEEAGNVSNVFEFTNNGDKPIVVQNVQTSCGCTAPEWTKNPIAPGQKGKITATFNPARRSGPFSKTITVFSTGVPNRVVLTISGKIIPKPKGIADYYPRLIGDAENGQIRMKSSVVPFYKIKNTEVKTDSLPIINIWDKPIKVGFRNSNLKHLKFKAVPEELKPQEKGFLIFTYDASAKNDWGTVSDILYLTFNGNNVAKGRLNVSATIYEDFSSLTEKERANAPKVSFENTKFDFGSSPQKTKIEHDFVFENTGKSDLVIYKIKASCGCTTVNPKDKIIKPGEKSNIKAIFDTRTYENRQTKYITVYTNDPDRYEIKLRITGTVIKE